MFRSLKFFCNQPIHIKRKSVAIHVICVILSTVLSLDVYAVENNVKFDGNLVAEPCTLDPNTTNFSLNLGDIIDKYLYINSRTHSKAFNINLLDCDLSLGSSVIVTFSGNPEPELPDLLSLSGGTARGIAVGLENSDGSALPINKPTNAFKLMKGNNILTFNAYVQGTPKAIQNRGIRKGDFTAISTFTLDYP